MKRHFIIFIAIIIAVGLWWFRYTSNHISINYDSPLMKPQSFDQKAVVKKLSENEKTRISRQSVVYFTVDSEDPAKRVPGNYVSRVIGLPGESVEMRESVIYVNGSPLTEPYAEEEYKVTPQNFSTIVVPNDSYFVVADDRKIIPINKYFVKINKIIGTVAGK